MQCRVINGYAGIGDTIKILGYIDHDGSFHNYNNSYYEYEVVGFKEYQGEMQILYKRIPSVNHPDQLKGIYFSWFSHATNTVEIVKKRETATRGTLKKDFDLFFKKLKNWLGD